MLTPHQPLPKLSPTKINRQENQLHTKTLHSLSIIIILNKRKHSSFWLSRFLTQWLFWPMIRCLDFIYYFCKIQFQFLCLFDWSINTQIYTLKMNIGWRLVCFREIKKVITLSHTINLSLCHYIFISHEIAPPISFQSIVNPRFS